MLTSEIISNYIYTAPGSSQPWKIICQLHTYKKILLLDISGCTQSICQGTGNWCVGHSFSYFMSPLIRCYLRFKHSPPQLMITGLTPAHSTYYNSWSYNGNIGTQIEVRENKKIFSYNLLCHDHDKISVPDIQHLPA